MEGSPRSDTYRRQRPIYSVRLSEDQRITQIGDGNAQRWSRRQAAIAIEIALRTIRVYYFDRSFCRIDSLKCLIFCEYIFLLV